ncbi:MAG: PKD domain-containing protein [Bacteroidota bacterium]
MLAFTAGLSTIAMANQPPNIVQMSDSQTVCEQEIIALFVLATGDSLTYQWEVSDNGGNFFVPLANVPPYANVQNDTLTILQALMSLDGYLFRCIVSGDCGAPDTSDAAELKVIPAPQVDQQPLGGALCDGEPKSFSVTATGTQLTYQWQRSPDGVTYQNLSNGTTFSNVNGATMNIQAVDPTMNTNWFRCLVGGTCSPADTSAAAFLKVFNPARVDLQPSDREVCQDIDTSFQVAFSGTNAAVQWQVRMGNAAVFQNVPVDSVHFVQADDARLPVLNAQPYMAGWTFRCITSGSCGMNDTSDVVTLDVSPQPFADFTVDVDVGTATFVNLSAFADQSIWHFGDGTFTISNDPVLTRTYAENGTYEVQLQALNGCGQASSSATVEVVGNGTEELSSRFSTTLYPNPSAGTIFVEVSGAAPGSTWELAITNLQGQWVLQETYQSDRAQLDLSRLPKGAYLAQLRMGDYQRVEQLFLR